MPEIIENLPYEDYAKRPGVNASLLKTVHRYSLAHAKAQIDGKLEGDSEEFDFGKAFHSLFLEGKREYVVHPSHYLCEEKKPGGERGEKHTIEKDWNWNANYCKDWAAQQTLQVMSAKEVEAMEGMALTARNALSGFDHKGRRELSVFAEKDGMPIKCRVDILPDDSLCPIIDPKTCGNANPAEFLKHALKYGYDIQCAWTLDVLRAAGIKRESMALLAIEKSAPYATCLLRLDDTPYSFLRLGRIKANAAFIKVKSAFETGNWPDYGATKAEEHAQLWQVKELEQTADIR